MIFHNLIVKGFQSHANVELSFSPGVNVICGLSNSGKTALLRAINLVVNNRPLGESFINWDANKATVGIILGDEEPLVGVVRTRGRDSSPNSYTIEDGSSEPPTFDAPGVKPPLPVAELLNMGDINIQKQLSPYYLVLNTPGEIAKQIRKTAGLDQLDRLVHRLDGCASTYSTMVGVWKENLETGELALKGAMQFNLEEFEGWVEELTVKVGGSKACASNVALLKLQIDDIKKIDAKILAYSGIDLVAVKEDVAENQRLVREAEVIRQEWHQLRQITKELRSIDYTKLPNTDAIYVVQSAMQAVVDKMSLENELNNINNVVADITHVGRQLAAWDQDIKVFEKGIAEAKEQLEVCPACGSMLTDETKMNLLGHSC